ncbi:RsmB/NOP family class I SAM-dependent RNA methyltransferase [Paenibacillus tarimensis]|uniref:RsmB/NOP family class I SAM-dependent RNA methyltransferase n=1 Tax=Paenibacillus tarimensis TaxID=416012 RepID=UPI001F3635AC|nr:RsmB/NOP family class I SAM-dependent RNA methyltransferase [Paenibacillus tarimensis]MCF2943253.1 RsmB/NOP family class I SAM-dependent RNA methyltransferase [Paenibacillus tarimensis]
MVLPHAYIAQMQDMLDEAAAAAFLQSYNEARTYGLRIHPGKLASNPDLFGSIHNLFKLEPVPWCSTGYYYDESARPGKHPYHDAGLYYIQEPSAMSAVELLDPQPGETILDLAAAPGGKSTQIAGKMNERGLLISNEIHPARARILSENMERLGFARTVVTNETPDRLSARFPAFFDRILLDSPCSGEGMFRKDPDAMTEWSPEHVAMCASRSSDILRHAAIMLKPGGILVYSTCTFNRSENESVIEAFTAAHPDFTVEQQERIWPHEQRGEGHFVARLRKQDSGAADVMNQHAAVYPAQSKGRKGRANTPSAAAELELFIRFAADFIPGFSLSQQGEPVRFGDALYWLPHDAEKRFTSASLPGLKIARGGLHLCDIRKNRVEPSHALAKHIRASEAAWVQTAAPGHPDTAAYLKGETITAGSGCTGWGLVAVDGCPLGWGKASGGQIKNHYPKGLRRMGM